MKLRNLILIMLCFFCAVPLIYAQSTGTVLDLDSYFANPVSFVLALPLAVEFIKRQILTNLTGLGIQIMSWTVGLFLSFIGWALKLGMFENLIWYEALITGAVCSLASNGIFQTGFITWILLKLRIIKNN